MTPIGNVRPSRTFPLYLFKILFRRPAPDSPSHFPQHRDRFDFFAIQVLPINTPRPRQPRMALDDLIRRDYEIQRNIVGLEFYLFLHDLDWMNACDYRSPSRNLACFAPQSIFQVRIPAGLCPPGLRLGGRQQTRTGSSQRASFQPVRPAGQIRMHPLCSTLCRYSFPAGQDQAQRNISLLPGAALPYR